MWIILLWFRVNVNVLISIIQLTLILAIDAWMAVWAVFLPLSVISVMRIIHLFWLEVFANVRKENMFKIKYVCPVEPPLAALLVIWMDASNAKVYLVSIWMEPSASVHPGTTSQPWMSALLALKKAAQSVILILFVLIVLLNTIYREPNVNRCVGMGNYST